MAGEGGGPWPDAHGLNLLLPAFLISGNGTSLLVSCSAKALESSLPPLFNTTRLIHEQIPLARLRMCVRPRAHVLPQPIPHYLHCPHPDSGHPQFSSRLLPLTGHPPWLDTFSTQQRAGSYKNRSQATPRLSARPPKALVPPGVKAGAFCSLQALAPSVPLLSLTHSSLEQAPMLPLQGCAGYSLFPLAPRNQKAGSLFSFWFLLKCHLCRKVFLGYPFVKQRPQTQSSLSPLLGLFSLVALRYVIYLLVWLWSWAASPSRKGKIPGGMDLVCFVHAESPVTRAVAVTDGVLADMHDWLPREEDADLQHLPIPKV